MTPEVEAKVREFVATAKQPLDAAAIRRLLKGEFAVKANQQAAFAQWLASLDGLIAWPPANAKSGPRYWVRTADELAEETVLKAAESGPVLPKKLAMAATKGKSGYPKDKVDALIARLEDEGKLHRQPLFAETKYKLTSKLGEESRAFLMRALQIVTRSLKALGENVPEAPAPSTLSPDSRILDALAAIEPQKGLLVTAPRLRRALPELSKRAFDEAVMRLYRSEKVLLHRHSGPFLLPAEERNELVQSGDSFYVGVCWNTGEE